MRRGENMPDPGRSPVQPAVRVPHFSEFKTLPAEMTMAPSPTTQRRSSTSMDPGDFRQPGNTESAMARSIARSPIAIFILYHLVAVAEPNNEGFGYFSPLIHKPIFVRRKVFSYDSLAFDFPK